MVKDAVPLGECGRVLVIKLRHHGDVLLAAPVLNALKVRGVEVDALIYDDTAPMLQGHPSLSLLHVVGRNWKAEGALSRRAGARGGAAAGPAVRPPGAGGGARPRRRC